MLLNKKHSCNTIEINDMVITNTTFSTGWRVQLWSVSWQRRSASSGRNPVALSFFQEMKGTRVSAGTPTLSLEAAASPDNSSEGRHGNMAVLTPGSSVVTMRWAGRGLVCSWRQYSFSVQTQFYFVLKSNNKSKLNLICPLHLA